MSRKTSTIRLSHESFESRSMLAGDIQFGEPLTLDASIGDVGIGRIHPVDVNDDEIVDLVVGNSCADASVLLGNGDLTFGQKMPVYLGDGSADVVPTDLDLDGDLDLVNVTRFTNDDAVYAALNNGTTDGRWNGYSEPIRIEGRGANITSRDLNGDMFPDVFIAAGRRIGTVSVLLNTGVENGQWQGLAAPIENPSDGNFS